MSDIREVIESFCEREGIELIKRYSGRGMYGKECYGIVCDSFRTLLVLGDYIRDNEFDSIVDVLGNVDVDNMGYQKIFYFKKITPCECDED